MYIKFIGTTVRWGREKAESTGRAVTERICSSSETEFLGIHGSLGLKVGDFRSGKND